MITTLLSVGFLLIGLIGGWFIADKYNNYLMATAIPTHDFEHLFENNPHPEIYDSEGNINRGEYIAIDFPPGFNPSDLTTGEFYIDEYGDEDM